MEQSWGDPKVKNVGASLVKLVANASSDGTYTALLFMSSPLYAPNLEMSTSRDFNNI
ncbi:hypothetical protein YC2023_121423 [Brassica napus]